MKRTVGALVLAAAVGGCMSSDHYSDVSSKPTVRASGDYLSPSVPGISGPWGEPVPMAAPYTASSPHLNSWQAQRMMSQSVPLDWVQMDPRVMQAGAQMPGTGMAMMPPGGMMAPPGVPFVPPMMAPGGGMMPPPNMPMPQGPAPSGMQLMSFCRPPGPGSAMPPPAANCYIGRTQIRFTGPDGMRIAWLTQQPGPDCRPGYSGPMVEAPGRYNFTQASIYRLKLSNIRGRPGLEVYPTLEVVPSNPKTAAFLAHSAVPLEFTAQDFQDIAEGKYLVKVIYLPDPQFQELAATGTDEIISTRLEPGADPILEAQRRGSILLVVRMGNVDQEAPNTPPLEGAGPNQAALGMMPPGMMPAPAMTGPAPSIPAPGNPVLPSLPSPTASTSKGQDASGIRPAGTLLTLPDLPPRAAAGPTPEPPWTPTRTSGSLPPPPPPMPPTPAELATQGSRQ